MSAETKAKWSCSNCKAGSNVALVGKAVEEEEEREGAASNTATTSTAADCLSPTDLQLIRELLSTELPKLIQTELSPLKKEIADLRDSVVFISNEFDSFKKELEARKNELNNMRREITELKSENKLMKSELADLQSYTRKDNVLLIGFPETVNESVYEIFDRISVGIGSSVKSESLSIAHRMPSRAKGAVKPIVLKFLRRQDKHTWMYNFGNSAKKDKTGPGISTKIIQKDLSEGRVLALNHLSPFHLDLLKKTKTEAENKGYKFVWVKDGRILVKLKEGKECPTIHIRTEDLIKI
ncbi:uncharacterized protein LOC120350290 [Nilaparvata lugens]|uniref:uncharacterized protein LOC120350290 n=1 Tax=Nilaparvata lugens TaxID=108931 RepID=UPI00193DFDC8|nr:uncharacterized protein LOC120350290 [Nilaparvata lugens]